MLFVSKQNLRMYRDIKRWQTFFFCRTVEYFCHIHSMFLYLSIMALPQTNTPDIFKLIHFHVVKHVLDTFWQNQRHAFELYRMNLPIWLQVGAESLHFPSALQILSWLPARLLYPAAQEYLAILPIVVDSPATTVPFEKSGLPQSVI